MKRGFSAGSGMRNTLQLLEVQHTVTAHDGWNGYISDECCSQLIFALKKASASD